MMGRAACAALDHVATQAMFSCDSQVDRWSVLGFFCAKLLSFSNCGSGWGHLPSTSAPRLIAGGYAEVPISSASADPCTPKQRPHSLQKTW